MNQNSNISMRNAKVLLKIGTKLSFSDCYLAARYRSSTLIKDKPRNTKMIVNKQILAEYGVEPACLI